MLKGSVSNRMSRHIRNVKERKKKVALKDLLHAVEIVLQEEAHHQAGIHRKENRNTTTKESYKVL